MSRFLLLVLAATIAMPACAPRVQTSPESRMVDDDAEQEANRQALDELYERGAEERAAEAAAGQPANISTSASNDLPVLPVVVVEPPETDAERGDGHIQRDDLRTFVEGGPHQLFRAFLLEPVLQEDRFRGYRVASISAGESGLGQSGLRVGDVVTAVNGTDISRPEGFMRVWETIADADQLRVEIVRQGDARTLAWAIE